MNRFLKTFMLLVLISSWSVSTWATSHEELNERNYFQFVIPEYHTSRQSGQTIDAYVRYAYKPGLPVSEYPDYRILRTRILKYLEPSEELPAEVFWEIIATNMGRELMHDFPLTGVSIQLYVHDNPNPDSFEPGDHGPTFTIGDIAPLDVHH